MIKKGLSLLLVVGLLTACQAENVSQETVLDEGESSVNLIELTRDTIQLTDSNQTFEEGLEGIKVSHDMTFEDFIQQGGASSDQEVVNFLRGQLGASLEDMNWTSNAFACSTLATQNDKDDYLFGRNFDWYNCDALMIESRPDKAYASISTVNTDFVSGIDFDQLPDAVKGTLALYAPYKNIFEAHGINGDNISKMPLLAFLTLDKNTLIEHFDQVVTVDDLTQEDLRLFSYPSQFINQIAAKYVAKYQGNSLYGHLASH